VLLVLTGCTAEQPTQKSPDVPILSLRPAGDVVSPDTVAPPQWFGALLRVVRDSVTGSFLAVDQPNARVVEFSPDGDLIAVYGRSGPGPGEFSQPFDVIVQHDTVFVLDLTGPSVVKFYRGGTFISEHGLRSSYHSFVAIGDSVWAFVPGAGGSGLDEYERNWEFRRHIDIEGDERGRCMRCLMLALSDSTFLYIEPETPLLLLVDSGGVTLRSIGFESHLFLNQWRKEEEELLGGRGGKLWIVDAARVSDSRVLLLALPGLAHERGSELWLVDIDEGLLARYRFDNRELFTGLAFDSIAYVTAIASGGLYRYSVPPVP